ncbi:MAG: flagellar biosynthesis regulator FlaF [Pseudomonadota bacterium]
MQSDAYRAPQDLNTPRALEYTAFSHTTSALSRAQNPTSHPSTPVDRTAQCAQRLEALHRNLMLWTVIFAAVTDPGNQLPRALCGQIAELAQFVAKYTEQARKTDADLEPLIDINVAIMRGLRGESTTVLAETA